MNTNSIDKLEFNKIRAQLAERAYSEGGRANIAALEFYTELRLVERGLDETEQAMELLRFGDVAFLGGVKPVKGVLARAKAYGALNPLELREIYLLLRASRLMGKFTASDSASALQPLRERLLSDEALEKRLDRSIDEEGYVRDEASGELASVRRQIESLRLKIRDYLQNFIRSGNNQSLLQDSIITERAGRYVVPVRQEHRNAVRGIVHDESASGATVFIEPLAVVEFNNKIRSLQAEEKREVERVLRELSAAVGQYGDDLGETYDTLGQLDFIFARARHAYDFGAFRPRLNRQGQVALHRARHPLLGASAVPVDIHLGHGFDILIITGPNTGGKTVALKTLGLLTLMAMAGMFVTAREDSALAVFDEIFVDIGDEQSIEQSLSTFSSHMSNIISILKQLTPNSLVLIDEIGAGTDPVEGSALARAILEVMKERRVRAMVSTHQSELKYYAYQQERVENACVEFDPIKLCPTYKLSIGAPGHSNAFEIAARLGLDEALVKRARALVPVRQMELNDALRQLQESKYFYEQAEEELKSREIKLRREEAALEQEREKFVQAQSRAQEKAWRETDMYLKQVKREATEALEEFKELMKDKQKPPKWHEVEQKQRRIRQLKLPTAPEEEEKTDPLPQLKSGDYVWVRNLRQYGYVLSPPDRQGEVAVRFGIVRATVKLDQCVISEAPEEKQSRISREMVLQKARDISPEIDLRGKMSAEALEELDRYLQDAILAGLERVRIIHGKGTGALRKAVREYLTHYPGVSEFGDGEREEGGFGVTVARMK
ncbi:MAG: endonuclease MutS2 [Syntrophomonadaceae bacterium]|nr:endonuclease MutS2 [Syntrophomonadaceae bacterium]